MFHTEIQAEINMASIETAQVSSHKCATGERKNRTIQDKNTFYIGLELVINSNFHVHISLLFMNMYES